MKCNVKCANQDKNLKRALTFNEVLKFRRSTSLVCAIDALHTALDLYYEIIFLKTKKNKNKKTKKNKTKKN